MKNKLFLILSTTLSLYYTSGLAQTVSWATPPSYESLEEYTETLYKIREKGKVGLADITGKTLVVAQYDSITPFVEHLAIGLEYSQGKYRIVNIINDRNYNSIEVNGNYFISEKYPFFSEGKLVIHDAQKKYGYLQEDGTLFKPCQYLATYPFYWGLACVRKGPKEIAYLKSNGNELVTELETNSYTLLTGSSFNEQGEAYVQGKGVGMKHCIINTEGRIVREAKHSGRKLTNYQFREVFTPENPTINTATDGVMPYQENGKYGYTTSGKQILPAQFTKAYPFRNGYARVLHNGRYGILKLVNGDFNCSIPKKNLTVKNGKSEKVNYEVNIPTAYRDKAISISISEGGKTVQDITLSSSEEHAFQPMPQNEVEALTYHLAIESEGLRLWEKSEDFHFDYIKFYPPILSAPQVSSEFKLDDNGYVRADKNNKVEVFATIENKSTSSISLSVTINGQGVEAKTETLHIPAESYRQITSTISNIKERKSVEINVITDNGLKSSSTIKVKPFI